MLEPIRDLMHSDKYIIAAVHTLPLPGSPYYDREGGMKKIIARAKSDAKILADNGVQAFLFTNEADYPYVFRMPQEGIAAFTAVISEVMAENTIPYGVNVLVDVSAAFSIAHATGASFIRGLFSGVYVTDNGIIENQGAKVFRDRANLGASLPYFFHNLASPIGMPLVARTGDVEAKSIMADIPVDGFTLPAKDIEMFKKVKQVAPDMPLVVGTGTNNKNLPQLLEVCDGTIVATCLRVDGQLFNPVDPKRVEDFMKIYRSCL